MLTRQLGHFKNTTRYVSKDTYTIEPIVYTSSQGHPRLVLRRDTGQLIVHPAAASIPIGFYDETIEADGILGLVPLLAGDYLVLITRKRHVGRLFPDSEHDVYAIEETRILPVHRSVYSLSEQQQRDEAEYLGLLERACNFGHMYYSTTWDLTSSMQANMRQAKVAEAGTPLWQKTDRRFFWNHYLQSKLIQLSASYPEVHGFILPVICGYVKIILAELNRKVFQYALITRKRVHRVGTRYHSRGIDDQGHVSNYVETEQVVCYQVPVDMVTHVRSYTQIRGSIPLFWRQKANSKYTPILELVQKPNSHQVFANHVNEQYQLYGDSQVMVNLINKKGYELPLGTEFKRQVDMLNDPKLKYIHFDFHEECKKMRYDRIALLEKQIADEVNKQSHMACTLPRVGQPIVQKEQKGVVRTNCIDCLDRTNVVQSVFAKSILIHQLRDLGILADGTSIDPSSDFEKQFKHMWADNADVVSVLYSGTGALKTDYTRTGQRTKQGALNDGYNSCIRYIKNNFLDGSRQDAYDLFLGNYRPASPPVLAGGKADGTRGLLTGIKSPLAKPKMTQAHGVLAAAVVLAGFMYSAALVFARETGVVVRTWTVTTLLFSLALTFILNRFGRELVDLPRLVPVDYVRDRELGLGSPIQ
ncbi:SacI homology domain-domain-containing protein [Catenaria anguillulae PL171]|uniref:SacI homology domain-domain-containing protein n=1 Tax=Catenaria anguillulae PL171 TaxID=765915 RepID=A0A1Y2HXW2_9FUNG|nr:SacI homology domain-domain-containing protein [Catenaria anguillulae PL171]